MSPTSRIFAEYENSEWLWCSRKCTLPLLQSVRALEQGGTWALSPEFWQQVAPKAPKAPGASGAGARASWSLVSILLRTISLVLAAYQLVPTTKVPPADSKVTPVTPGTGTMPCSNLVIQVHDTSLVLPSLVPHPTCSTDMYPDIQIQVTMPCTNPGSRH